jgi:NADPH-dependent ferric siderophore reductase
MKSIYDSELLFETLITCKQQKMSKGDLYLFVLTPVSQSENPKPILVSNWKIDKTDGKLRQYWVEEQRDPTLPTYMLN